MSQYIIVGWLAGFDGRLIEGYIFEQWPLHITIVPWFKAKNDNQIKLILINSIKNFEPIQLRAQGFAMFGRNKNVRVLKLAENKQLRKIHQTILKNIKNNKLEFVYNRENINFRPHITIQPEVSEIEIMNKNIFLTKIAIIKHLETGKAKQIILAI